MRRRLLYGSAVVLLAALVTVLVWQVSFNQNVVPADLSQTFMFWGVSTLVFLLTIILGWILFRTGVKLYIERQSNREGTRIKSKLFFGAVALSFLPVIFQVAFSYLVLNRSIDKWFAAPAEGIRTNYITVGQAIKKQQDQRLSLAAQLLASADEARGILSGAAAPVWLERVRAEHGLSGVAIARTATDPPIAKTGTLEPRLSRSAVVKADGKTIGVLIVAADVPIDVAQVRSNVEEYVFRMNELAQTQKYWRAFYVLMQTLIALFTLFLATWMALFLAKQISVPISALLRGAGEVGRGNLTHRVEVEAIDELGGLVHGFNQMTSQLDSNSRELEARRRFTEAILESIPSGVLSLAADGSVLRVNRAFRKMFSEEKIAAATRLEDLFSREDTAEIKYLMKRARRAGSASREIEFRSGGRVIHAALTVSALEDKLTSGFVVVIEDLTDLLHAQKAAAWHEVARRVAHEIKNPLTPIALSAERITRQIDKLGLPGDVARIVRECTATIQSEVGTVKTLVDEFATYARFPAAQPVRGDLNEVVESALAVFAGRLDGVALHTHLAPSLPAVNLDREQFKRAIVNLIDNAAEAMQDSLVREIRISTRAAGDMIELEVADTGCGVTPEEKEKLFLPYFSTKGRGTGLGLAIVSHILADHGARIRTEDNQPAGTRFVIEIPVLVDLSDTSEFPAPVIEVARA